MKNLILAAPLMGSALGAQKLQPVVGIHWTGGWSYSMEHELPSAELGILYSPKKSILTNAQLTGNLYYDFVPACSLPAGAPGSLMAQSYHKNLAVWDPLLLPSSAGCAESL